MRAKADKYFIFNGIVCCTCPKCHPHNCKARYFSLRIEHIEEQTSNVALHKLAERHQYLIAPNAPEMANANMPQVTWRVKYVCILQMYISVCACADMYLVDFPGCH